MKKTLNVENMDHIQLEMICGVSLLRAMQKAIENDPSDASNCVDALQGVLMYFEHLESELLNALDCVCNKEVGAA